MGEERSELKLNRGKEGNGETYRRRRVNGALASSAETGGGRRGQQGAAAGRKTKKEDECAECMVHCTVLKC